MFLSHVMDAPFDYQGDMQILLDPGKDGHPNGFRYGTYDARNGWRFEKKDHMSIADVNILLKEKGYHQLLKKREGSLFKPVWEYRCDAPDWTIFQSWLYTFYERGYHELYSQHSFFALHDGEMLTPLQALSYEEDYAAILDQLYMEPDYASFLAWIQEARGHIEEGQLDQSPPSYRECHVLLLAYHDLIEKRKQERLDDVALAEKLGQL